ncbi:hypothetical protein BGX23_004027 [Mortierella sp. AD031]|nr:hypothetical protein BGX23_004027 [Mortierella sp. AD031]
MPVAMPRGDRGNHWTPRANLDSFTTPFPLYSGYLLKLGSNNRWQSRLFTFDGAGKRRRTPPIATYDPHVSSPFASAPCRNQPYNPNTKWFLHIAAITDIRLLPSPKSYRCVPSSDLSRSLFIQTADGRTLTLRAKQNIELERWFFVLTKLWAFQQLLQRTEEDLPADAAAAVAAATAVAARTTGECTSRHEGAAAGGAVGGTGGEGADQYHQLVLSSNLHRNHPNQQQQNHNNNNFAHHSSSPSPSSCTALPPCSSQLPAHQQSSQLFNNYLQRQLYLQQQQQQDQEDDCQFLHTRQCQQQQPHSQSQSQSQPLSQQPQYKSYLPMGLQRQTAPPITTRIQESLLRYQISLPRVSAFLPGSLDWPAQQQQQQQQQQTQHEGREADGQGAAVVAAIDDEKTELQESGENIRAAYLKKSPSFADQLRSSPTPPLQSPSQALLRTLSSAANLNNGLNSNTTTTMTAGVSGGGVGSSGMEGDGEQNKADGSLKRQGGGAGVSWAQEPGCSIPTIEEVHAGSPTPGLALHQPILWPAAGTMEPAKAAAIDMWRRNLMSPLARAVAASSFHSDDPDNQALIPASAAKLLLSKRRPSGENDRLIGLGYFFDADADADADADEEEDEDLVSPHNRSKWFHQREPYQQPRLAMDSVSSSDNLPLAVVRHIRQTSLGTKDIEKMGAVEIRQQNEDGTDRHVICKIPEPEILNVQQRLSRWQKTQLSSEDESGTNRDSFAALTNTSDMNRNSYPTLSNRNSYPTLSNRDSYLNLNSRDRDPYSITSSENKDQEPKNQNQRRRRVAAASAATTAAEQTLPKPTSSPFMDSSESPSATTPPPTVPTRPLMAPSNPIITTSILKRPSLPGMDTASLQAAVETNRTSIRREKSSSSHPNSSSPPRAPLQINTSNNDSNRSSPTGSTSSTPYRPPVSGFLPPPPTRPPRRHPIAPRLKTLVSTSDVKSSSSSRRDSQDGSIASSGFGCGGNGGGNGGASNGASSTITTTTGGKVEKSRSMFSFLALSGNYNSNKGTSSSPMSVYSSGPARQPPQVPPRRNSLPAVHFLGLGLSLGPDATSSSSSSNNYNSNGNNNTNIRRQQRLSILSLNRGDKGDGYGGEGGNKEGIVVCEQAEVMIHDSSPPQTPSSAVVRTLTRPSSSPAAVSGSSSSSLSFSFSPITPTTTSSSSPVSMFISATATHNNSNKPSLRTSSCEPGEKQYHHGHHGHHRQYQQPLIQVDAPAPTPVSQQEKEKEQKEKEKEKKQQELEQHKSYCRSNSIGGNKPLESRSRPLTCCSESELMEVLNSNSEEDDDFCYF